MTVLMYFDRRKMLTKNSKVRWPLTLWPKTQYTASCQRPYYKYRMRTNFNTANWHSISTSKTSALTQCNIMLLKLYCRYLYTRPYMINRIWSLKQLWLQVNGHAWFHLHGLRWPVRNGEGAKNSKWKYMFPVGFELTPRQSMTGKSQRLRPLGYAG